MPEKNFDDLIRSIFEDKCNEQKCQDLWRSLLTGLGPQLCAFGRQLGLQDVDAENALQDTFLALQEKAERNDLKGKPTALVYSIYHHKAVDILRLLGRLPGRDTTLSHRPGDAPPSEEPKSRDPDPKKALEDKDLSQVIDDGINALRDLNRQIYVLVDINRWTLRQAAIDLGVAEGTLKSRLHQARMFMMSYLADRGVFPP